MERQIPSKNSILEKADGSNSFNSDDEDVEANMTSFEVIDSFKHKYDRLQKQLQNERHENASAIKALKGKNRALRVTIADLEGDNLDLEECLGDAGDQISFLELEINEAKQMLANTTMENTHLKERLDKHEEEMEHKVAEYETKIHHLIASQKLDHRNDNKPNSALPKDVKCVTKANSEERRVSVHGNVPSAKEYGAGEYLALKQKVLRESELRMITPRTMTFFL